jgi:hypothetical protein
MEFVRLLVLLLLVLGYYHRAALRKWIAQQFYFAFLMRASWSGWWRWRVVGVALNAHSLRWTDTVRRCGITFPRERECYVSRFLVVSCLETGPGFYLVRVAPLGDYFDEVRARFLK